MTRKEALKITKDAGLTGGAQNIGIAILLGDTTTTGGAWDNVRKLLKSKGQTVPEPTKPSTPKTTPTTTEPISSGEQSNLNDISNWASQIGDSAVKYLNTLSDDEKLNAYSDFRALANKDGSSRMQQLQSKINTAFPAAPTQDEPTPETPTTPTPETTDTKYYDENGNEYTGDVFTNKTTGAKTDSQGNILTPSVTDPETGEQVQNELLALPESVTGSEYFQQLSPAQQAQVLNYYNVAAVGDEQYQTAFLETLELAEQYAEPGIKDDMRLVADNVANSISQLTGNYQISADRLKKNLDQIQEDIKSGAEQLTIEEENTKRQQALNYSNQLDNLASRGLVSSTFRSNVDAQARGLRESTTRQEARNRQSTDRAARAKARELEQRFGTTGAQKLLQAQDPITGQAIEGAQNQQTSGLGNFLLGGIEGTEKQKRATDVYNYAGALSPLNETLNPLPL